MEKSKKLIGDTRSSFSSRERERKLDEKDLLILAEVELDPFAPVTKLARKVHMSSSAVGIRLSCLETCGYIERRRASVLVPERLGYNVEFFMKILVRDMELVDWVKSRLGEMAHIRLCWSLTNLMLLAFAVARDVSELGQILTCIKDLEGVQKVETDLVISTVIDRHKFPPELLRD